MDETDFASNPERALRWKGLRQDSGDPLQFLQAAKGVFEKIGADPKKSAFLVFCQYSYGLDLTDSRAMQRSSSTLMLSMWRNAWSWRKLQTKLELGVRSESGLISRMVRSHHSVDRRLCSRYARWTEYRLQTSQGTYETGNSRRRSGTWEGRQE